MSLHLGACLAVAFCWGFTTPLIKAASANLNKTHTWPPAQQFSEIVQLLCRWQYLLPLIINLSGSIVWYALIGDMQLSRVVPIVNSLAFVFQLICAYIMGEKTGGIKGWIGIFLVVLGVYICSK